MSGAYFTSDDRFYLQWLSLTFYSTIAPFFPLFSPQQFFVSCLFLLNSRKKPIPIDEFTSKNSKENVIWGQPQGSQVRWLPVISSGVYWHGCFLHFFPYINPPICGKFYAHSFFWMALFSFHVPPPLVPEVALALCGEFYSKKRWPFLFLWKTHLCSPPWHDGESR